MSVLAVDVEVAGVRAAFSALRRGLANLTGSWAQVGARMVNAAVPIVPTESGRLVASLKAQAGPAGVEVGSDLIYAGVQNYGWPAHNIAGHHFLERAGDELADGPAVNELATGVQAVIDRVGLR